MKKITKFTIYSVGVIAFTKSMKYFLDKNKKIKEEKIEKKVDYILDEEDNSNLFANRKYIVLK